MSLLNGGASVFDAPAGAKTTSLLNGKAPLAAPPTQADAWDANSKAYGDWVAKERADGIAKGLIDPQTGWPTKAGLEDAARQLAQSVMMGTTAPGAKGAGFTAYHGSPHSFDQFQSSAIGTGEGAQAYGHGLYFADAEHVARSYRDTLAGGVDYQGGGYPGGHTNPAAKQVADRITGPDVDPISAIQQTHAQFMAAAKDARSAGGDTPAGKMNLQRASDYEDLANQVAGLNPKDFSYKQGHMYEVGINADPAHFLDWDKPRDFQPAGVQEFAREHYPSAWDQSADGSSLYNLMAQHALRERGSLEKMLAGKRADGDMRAFPEYEAQVAAMSNPHAYVSEQMAKAGIPGIRYLDGGSRADGTGTSNHVIFDPATVAILRKYGIAGVMTGGAAAAGKNDQ